MIDFLSVYSLLLSQLPKRNREAFGLDWIKEGFSPEHLRNHMLYLEKLVDRITSLTRESLADMFEEERVTIPTSALERELYMEVIQHTTFCQHRSVYALIILLLLTWLSVCVCST